MCEYATQREMFGSTLSRKANIQDWIAEARAEEEESWQIHTWRGNAQNVPESESSAGI